MRAVNNKGGRGHLDRRRRGEGARTNVHGLIILVMAWVVLLSGCPAAVVGVAGGAFYAKGSQRSLKEVAQDSIITATIKSKFLADDRVKAWDINVDTYKGEVTLSGTVADPETAQRAVALAKEVEGVKRVVSKLRVAGGKVSKPAGPPPAVCQEVPAEVLHGQGYITGSRANFRRGPSTRCPVLGSLRGGETVALLGKRGRWFYVERPDGARGWIHSSLVQEAVARAPEARPRVRKTVAVLPFAEVTPESQSAHLGQLVAEKILTAIVRLDTFKTVERGQLQKVVRELELGQTGLLEASKAAEIGKMANAHAIITGSVALVGKVASIDARIIDVESGLVISAASATDRYTLGNLQRMCRRIAYELSRDYEAKAAPGTGS